MNFSFAMPVDARPSALPREARSGRSPSLQDTNPIRYGPGGSEGRPPDEPASHRGVLGQVDPRAHLVMEGTTAALLARSPFRDVPSSRPRRRGFAGQTPSGDGPPTSPPGRGG